MTYFTVFGLLSLKSDVSLILVSSVLDKSKSLDSLAYLCRKRIF